jgi:hypothetical protein
MGPGIRGFEGFKRELRTIEQGIKPATNVASLIHLIP